MALRNDDGGLRPFASSKARACVFRYPRGVRALLLPLGAALVLSSACATERAARPSDDGRTIADAPQRPKPKPRVAPEPATASDVDPAPLAPETLELDPQEGVISWYHDSLAGRRTASGERYDPRARTCAHRKHPFGTRLRVTLVDTGASVECRVNDRGPFVAGRVLDVSRVLAEELDLIERGVAPGRVVRLVEAAPEANEEAE